MASFKVKTLDSGTKKYAAVFLIYFINGAVIRLVSFALMVVY